MAAATRNLKQNLSRWLILLFILLLAAFLRFYRLSGQSLWADEGNSVALARRSLAEIAQRTAFDIHPPFYYWLLKIWIAFFGDDETGLRSLSAILGVGLVCLTWMLGAYLFNRRVGVIAAFIAAISPLQVYYSQEARMYMLLALLGGLTFLVALLLLDRPLWFPNSRLGTREGTREAAITGSLSLLYILIVSAGLYTHYAYPLILILANLAALARFKMRQQLTLRSSPLLLWLGLQLIPLCLYLPWLPVAWRQVTTWPSEQQPVSLPEMINTITVTLLAGLSWPYGRGLAMAAGLILLLGLASLTGSSRPHLPARLLLWLWLLLPVGLTIFIFSPAFLKFLLIASPALALLLALAVDNLAAVSKTSTGASWMGYLLGGALLMLLSSLSMLALIHYYTDAAYARDNYRGIVQFIKAVGETGDAIVLDAEGQQDVFNYYAQDYHLETPVYPLPRRRPLDEAATLAELAQIAATAGEIYGVYWATHQADPDGLIERWLDTHLFKATDQWYGNVRLVSYATPHTQLDQLSLVPVNQQLGETIQLTGYAVTPAKIPPGDILQVALRWQTAELLNQDYTIFLQLLDPANHIVGQRDIQPGRPTSTWSPGAPILDSQGLFVEPGTPPGKHRLIVGMVDQETGQRLPVSQSAAGPDDFIELGEVDVVPPAALLPPAAFNIQVSLNKTVAELSLLGYDWYKLGYRSRPETPIHTGDPVQLVAYWRLDQPVSSITDSFSIKVVRSNGQETPVSITQPLAGIDYPVSQWQVGEIVRAQYDFFLSGLEPGSYQLALTWQGQTLLTKPFEVENMQ